ncbi:hypothetical protein BJ508DRAFT_377392 [Ascobolus immersus RN42]|uniref:CBM-cenC domain-containing protein n=1 Tax=Ascobolus immersus RN42 TaxID=1160509 RepID=A0A3N4I346_ASCIM|nr:hypothetical protein BJ508DRAFT_377392 [Ascobolus immersus RN42]
MKITSLSLAALMAAIAAATPFWERDHNRDDRWDDRHCRPRTVVETRWKARTTTTRTKTSTRTKTITVKDRWNHRPNVITKTKLQTSTVTVPGRPITVTGKGSTTTITIPGGEKVTTVTIPGEGKVTTVTIPTAVTLPGEELTTTAISTLTIPEEIITVSVPTTVTIPGDEVTTTTTLTEPVTVTDKATTITVPGDEITTTSTVTEAATVTGKQETIIIPGDDITVTFTSTVTEPTTITIPGDEITSTTTITEPVTVTGKAETVTIPGDEITTTTTLTEPVTVEGPTTTTTSTVGEPTTVTVLTTTTETPAASGLPDACSFAIGSTTNLLANGDLESDTAGNWVFRSINTNSNVQRVAGVGKSGYGLRFRIDAADLALAPPPSQIALGSTVALTAAQAVPVCPGARYSIRAELKMLQGPEQQSMGLVGYVSDGATLKSVFTLVQGSQPITTPVWVSTPTIFSFIVAQGVTRQAIILGAYSGNGSGTKEMHVDNIQLLRTG